jgi:hypothetical protein
MGLAFSKIAQHCMRKIGSKYVEVRNLFSAFTEAKMMVQSDFEFDARL